MLFPTRLISAKHRTPSHGEHALPRTALRPSLASSLTLVLPLSPADIRGAHHALAASALESAKAAAKAASSPPTKKRKTSSTASTKRKAASKPSVDAYHYIGYVPAHGRVWELDGLRARGPLDVGEIHADADRKSTRLNSSHSGESRMPSSA